MNQTELNSIGQAKLVEVILTNLALKPCNSETVHRHVTQVWSKEGELLAETDVWKETERELVLQQARKERDETEQKIQGLIKDIERFVTAVADQETELYDKNEDLARMTDKYETARREYRNLVVFIQAIAQREPAKTWLWIRRRLLDQNIISLEEVLEESRTMSRAEDAKAMSTVKDPPMRIPAKKGKKK